MTDNTKPVPWQTKAMGRFQPRERHPHEALPNTINVHALPPYKPEPAQSVRAGADDFRAIQSRGFPT